MPQKGTGFPGQTNRFAAALAQTEQRLYQAISNITCNVLRQNRAGWFQACLSHAPALSSVVEWCSPSPKSIELACCVEECGRLICVSENQERIYGFPGAENARRQAIVLMIITKCDKVLSDTEQQLCFFAASYLYTVWETQVQHEQTRVHGKEDLPVGQTHVAIQAEQSTCSREEEGISKQDILNIVSHEFRSAMNVMFTSLQMMQSHLQLHQPQDYQNIYQRWCMKMDKSIHKTLRISDNILDCERVEDGMWKLHAVTMDLACVLKQLQEEILCYMPHSGATLHFCNLKQRPCIMAIDREVVERILLNLISNAMKYADANPVGVVKLILHEAGAHVEIAVENNGTGINPQIMPHLFEKYYRAPGQGAGAKPGAGLGLYLSQKMAVLHGGYITVENLVQGGTRFCLHLPKQLPSQHEPGILTSSLFQYWEETHIRMIENEMSVLEDYDK